MKQLIRYVAIAIVASASTIADAATTSINLGNYRVTGNHSIATNPGGGVSGLEASAVAYARDRGTLFFVGDEGTGIVEISRTGQTIGTMAFDWTGAGSSNHDSEGLTYLGGGEFVLAEERLQNAYRFTYAAGGTFNLASTPFASIGPTVGNVGVEGISYDPRNGNFVTVKQDEPAELRIFNSLSFSTVAGLDVVPDILFTGASALFGLTSLSDVQTLAPVDALLGTLAADNLLVLSLESRKLIEISRSGQILSSLDLAGITPQAIEGVTVDEKGVIYLVAEDSGFGNSKLFVLTPVPEPETYALMLAGLALVGLQCAAETAVYGMNSGLPSELSQFGNPFVLSPSTTLTTGSAKRSRSMNGHTLRTTAN